ncbi:MAG: ribosome small subunit-dependent GTPase A [Coriobacteriia bacterium]|nr:ribosome small subunit-dependent GTPase A [Coriobacteriia bacterium]
MDSEQIQEAADQVRTGQVIKLDRGFPLVRCLDDGLTLRCEHATDLVKEGKLRVVIGDLVEVLIPAEHDKGIIQDVLERRTQLVRKDPAERAVAQVMAANFDLVIVAQPISEVNLKRLERELVLAFETGAKVAVALTKADLVEDGSVVDEVRSQVEARAGATAPVLVMSAAQPETVEAVRALIPEGTVAVLVGKSGVGKSSMINLLVGREVQETGSVREGDGKGRHTTVSREIVPIPGGGFVVDMPGVRGVGVWEAEAGIGAAFADVEEAATRCRFRDCRHQSEPGCAVRAAVEEGLITQERLDSYLSLTTEVKTLRERKEEARRMQGTKASDERAGKRGGHKRVHRARKRR